MKFFVTFVLFVSHRSARRLRRASAALIASRVTVRERVPPPVPGPDSSNADAALVRGIGLSGATLLVIGSVIGSGIFLTTGSMMQTLPSPTLVIAAWIAGGLLATAGGLTYAEMGSMFPRSVESPRS